MSKTNDSNTKKTDEQDNSVDLDRRNFYRNFLSSAGTLAADVLRGGSAQKPSPKTAVENTIANNHSESKKVRDEDPIFATVSRTNARTHRQES